MGGGKHIWRGQEEIYYQNRLFEILTAGVLAYIEKLECSYEC